MDLRQRFVLEALEPGANVSALCREYNISRKTGYKWIARLEEAGVQGLADLSRRPRHVPVKASGEMVLRVLELRAEHPQWGAKKIQRILARVHDDAPSVRTVGRILERAGEIRRRRKVGRLHRPTRRPQPSVEGPNDLWTVDIKGWWNAKDGARCEPLTVRDAFSRYVLCARLMEESGAEAVQRVFEGLFADHGLPARILADNGPPFASTRARLGMTRLSAWWTAVGVEVLRSRPGHPEDNAGHERMCLDIRREVQDATTGTLAEGQARLDAWRQEFNHVRPHEALDMRTPAEVYRRSVRSYRGVRPARYPGHCVVRKVQSSGRVRYRGGLLLVGGGFRGYHVGIEAAAPGKAHVYFYELDLGLFDAPV